MASLIKQLFLLGQISYSILIKPSIMQVSFGKKARIVHCKRGNSSLKRSYHNKDYELKLVELLSTLISLVRKSKFALVFLSGHLNKG